MKKKLKILLIASEVTPIAKRGGLADVVGSLPKELTKMGIDARIALPKYNIIDAKKYPQKLVKKGLSFERGKVKEKFNVYQTKLPGSQVKVYLIDSKYFHWGDIYLERTAFVGSFKEIERFLIFTRAVAEMFPKLNWWPDIIHFHDWHTSMIPTFLKMKGGEDKRYKKIKTLLTMHNLENQGTRRPHEILDFMPLDDKKFKNLKIRDQWKNLNLFQQGIITADFLNTVSPTYAQEILTKELGVGLHKDLKKRKSKLVGILNGIDYTRFNPVKDEFIKTKYSTKTLNKKEVNKLDLQRITKLPKNKDIPVFGLVSRLTGQKGIDWIIETLPKLIKEDAQFIFLGTGAKDLEEGLKKAAKKYPKKVYTKLDFDAKFAQQIYAGSDFFLMPSRFEPCGLGQLIAMAYGTPPIVRATGGLKDTVNSKTGIVFEKPVASRYLKAVKKALKIYQNPKKFKQLQVNCMKQDFSWGASTKKYLEVYKKLTK